MKDIKKVTRIVAAVLTVAFLGFVFVAFGVMITKNGGDLIDSVSRMSELKGYLPENWNALDLLQARINSLTAATAEHMWLKDEMGYINSGFQYALGKQMINTGNQNMIRLNTGHFYDLQSYKSLEDSAADVIELKNTVLKDTPFLFVYEHPTLYDQSMMPAGYESLDHSKQMANEIVAALTEGGVEVLDSRDVLMNSGYPLEDLLMYTDQHWSTLSALTMAQSIAETLKEMAGADIDPTLLDMDQMNTQVHENLFMGKYGQRVGTDVVEPDDIIEYWPKYETNISRHTKQTVSIQDVSGSFREVAIRADRLEPDEGKTWNTLAYTYYGQVEAYDIYTNESAPDITIMLLKDSYSAPIAPFLSLMARNVVSLDLRRDIPPLSEWMEQYEPDVVIMAYSLQMLRDDEYDFGD